MAVRGLHVHIVAVNGDLVARLEQVHPGPDLQHHPGRVATQDVIRQIVPAVPRAFLGVPFQEQERRQWLKDGTPDRIEINAGGHDRDQGLIRADFRDRHLVKVQALSGVFFPGLQLLEHVYVVLMRSDRQHRLRERKPLKVFGFGLAIHDGGTDILHLSRHGYLLLLLVGCPVGISESDRVTLPDSTSPADQARLSQPEGRWRTGLGVASRTAGGGSDRRSDDASPCHRNARPPPRLRF